jgi:hypothetical protein
MQNIFSMCYLLAFIIYIISKFLIAVTYIEQLVTLSNQSIFDLAQEKYCYAAVGVNWVG